MNQDQVKHITQFLPGVSFFSEVSEKALVHLSENISISRFRKNETIFHKDDEGHSMYVILDGKVRVQDGDHILGYLGKSECFGEYALIDNKGRSASVVAEIDTQLLEITRDHFMDLMANDVGFAQGVLSVLIKRHRELDIIQERLAASKSELAMANAQLTSLFNGAMDAIIVFNNNFRILLVNPSAERLLENDDVQQRNLLFFMDEGSAAVMEKLKEENNPAAFNNFLPEYIRIIGSNGTEVITEGTISKYGEESNPLYILILRNIEGRLAAEETITRLTSETKYLKAEIDELTHSHGIIAKDKNMKAVLKSIDQVAATDATVLITGETGTGKELVARAIHDASLRKDQPFIRINCGAIPANLIESELFGHEKGAFTGATISRKGRFLLAHKGTIFLDEIGELPLDLQPKLLRVIQEGEFDPVGSSETIKVDVRILAATHRDLLKYSEEGKFREDLYYRLNVFPIHLPALRERGTDIILIAESMLKQYTKKMNRSLQGFSEEEKELLMSYHWPGNVRELQNLIERAVIISDSGAIAWHTVIPSQSATSTSTEEASNQGRILSKKEFLEFERNNILRALKLTGWKIAGKNGAAALLDVPVTTLASRMKALNIERPI